MTTATSTKHEAIRQWHYFTLTVDIHLPSELLRPDQDWGRDAITDEVFLVMRDALKDYGIGDIGTSPWTEDTYQTVAAICYSTIAPAETVMADLLTRCTKGLREDGYHVEHIAIRHDLTEPNHSAAAAFGEDKFNV